MAVYNGEPYMAAAIESVLRQAYDNFEFVIVNDASTDRTAELLQEFAVRDARLVLITNVANRGMAASLNRGLQTARGLYVARQDADDISEPERLAQQVAVLDKRPEVGLVSSWVNIIDADGQPMAMHQYPDNTGNAAIQAQLLIANCICHGSVMFRRALLQQAGNYDEHLEGTEDYDLWLRLAEITELDKVPLYLYRYRFHAASFSESRRPYQAWQQARTLEKTIARRYGPPPNPQRYRPVAKAFLMAAEISQQRGAAGDFEDRLAHALLICPELFAEPDTFVPLPPLPEGRQVLDRVFSQLPATGQFRGLLRQLLAREHMRRVFAAAGSGDLAELRAHLWAGLYQDPRWLLNRGVWALAARALLGRRVRRSPPAPVPTASGAPSDKPR